MQLADGQIDLFGVRFDPLQLPDLRRELLLLMAQCLGRCTRLGDRGLPVLDLRCRGIQFEAGSGNLFTQ